MYINHSPPSLSLPTHSLAKIARITKPQPPHRITITQHKETTAQHTDSTEVQRTTPRGRGYLIHPPSTPYLRTLAPSSVLYQERERKKKPRNYLQYMTSMTRKRTQKKPIALHDLHIPSHPLHPLHPIHPSPSHIKSPTPASSHPTVRRLTHQTSRQHHHIKRSVTVRQTIPCNTMQYHTIPCNPTIPYQKLAQIRSVNKQSNCLIQHPSHHTTPHYVRHYTVTTPSLPSKFTYRTRVRSGEFPQRKKKRIINKNCLIIK